MYGFQPISYENILTIFQTGYTVPEGSEGILVRDRFGFVAEEKNFRIVIALHINWVLITATKIYISVE